MCSSSITNTYVKHNLLIFLELFIVCTIFSLIRMFKIDSLNHSLSENKSRKINQIYNDKIKCTSKILAIENKKRCM
jgi:hypothetical protein